MKKLSVITLTVLLAMILIVSCSPDSAKPADGLALITFNAGERTERSLTRTNPELDPNQFYWFYTATKTDGTGLVTGAVSTQTAVKAGSKGLGTVGPFSYGDWNFTLYGYVDDNRQQLVYSGTSDLTVKDTTNTLTVTVESKQTAGVTGHLDFPAKGSIALTGGGEGEVNWASFIEEITIKRVDGTEQDDTVKYDYVNTDGKNGLRRINLLSGSYSVTFKYWQGATLTSASNTNTLSGGYVVAEEAIYVAIADHLTTTIGGDLASNKGQVEIKVESGIVEIKKTASISTTGATEIKVAAAPVSATATATEEQTESATVATTILIPQGAISGTSVEAKTTSYSREAVAATKPTFTIEEEAEDSGTTTTTEAVVLGGLDIDLYVDSSTAKTTDFSGDNALTITTYITKGLKDSDIVIKYDGPKDENGNNKSDGTVVSYDSDTGKLIFTVDHLSSYYFVSKSAVIFNTTKSSAHESLADAVDKASSGDTLILVKDIVVKSAITLGKNLTVDLQGHTVTIEVTAEKADAFTLPAATSTYSVVFKNGTVKGKAANNTFTLNSHSSFILDAVAMDVECLRGIQVKQGSNPASLEIRNGSSVTVTDGYYAVATNAGNAENTYVSIRIDNSTLRTVSSENRIQYKGHTTALLVNVPSALQITGSKIIGEKQGAIIRGADTVHTKKISNTEIETTSDETNYGDDLASGWTQGNGVPLAALVIGDNSTSYPFGTTVELDNVTLKNKETEVRRSIWVYQDEHPVKVTGSLTEGYTVNTDINADFDFGGVLVGDKYYKTLTNALNVATSGDTITLLDCSDSNEVPDDTVSKYTWKVIHNNCGDEADGYWHEESNSFNGGYGTKVEPYLVSSFEQLEKIYSEKGSDYAYYKWSEKDGTLDASNWDPSNLYLHGSFDGNGLTVNNLDDFMFRAVWNGSDSWAPSEDTENIYTIKNLTINVKIMSSGWAAAVVRTVGVHKFVMENVKVHGYIEGSTGVASFICYGPGNYDSSYTYGGDITFKDCYSDMMVVAKSGAAVGFIAHPMMTSEGKIALVNSAYTGSMSAVSEGNCKYISGNWTNAKISDDNANASSLYASNENGWKYVNSGKISVVSFEDKSISDFSVNFGDVITIDAEDDANKATVSLVISPGPKCFTSTYESEDVTLAEGKFTSNKIKYFKVRINPEDVTKSGINGTNYDVVNSVYDHSLDADTIIRFTQYDNDGKIVKITNISLGDKTAN